MDFYKNEEGLTGWTGAPVEDPPDLKKQGSLLPELINLKF